MKIAIIGGGASGLFCAAKLYALLKNKNVSIDIIEKDKKVGRKVLMTGNGKGNISNSNVSSIKYNSDFVSHSLDCLSYLDLVNFFESKGVLLTKDEEGRVYPRSETSNTILDTLRSSYESNFINEVLETNVERLNFEKEKIRVIGKNFNKLYDYVVVTTGTKAGLNNIPNNFNEELIKSTNHKLTSSYPALSPLFVKENIASLRGVRAKVKASMEIDKLYEVEGEVLFKDDSLSGICMFELSTFYARNMIKNKLNKVSLELDFLKEYKVEFLIDKLKEILNNLPNNDASLLLNGFFPKMLAKYILDASKLNLKGRKNKDLNDKELEIIALNIKKQRFNIETKKTSSNCQVMVGGVDLNEVNPSTLESKLHSNLFFGGEVLNIDGQCGGFNLHFAFASGNLIAESISKRIGEQYEKNS